MRGMKWPEGSASTNFYFEPYDESLDRGAENEKATRPYDKSRDLGRLIQIADKIAAMDFTPDHIVMVDMQHGEIEYAFPVHYTGEQMKEVEGIIAEIMDQDPRTSQPVQQPSIFTLFSE